MSGSVSSRSRNPVKTPSRKVPLQDVSPLGKQYRRATEVLKLLVILEQINKSVFDISTRETLVVSRTGRFTSIHIGAIQYSLLWVKSKFILS